jgi:hypothetical protein
MYETAHFAPERFGTRRLTQCFTGTYVLGVPKYGLSIVLLTNRQNMGADAHGYFPDVGPLQQAVARVVVDAAAQSAH